MTKALWTLAATLALAACGQHDNGSNAQDLQSDGAVDRAGTVDDPAVAQAKAQPADNTHLYVSEAAIGDMYEIQSSQIALKKAHSEKIKAFAKQMIADHTATTAQLKQLAALPEVGRVLPTELDAKHKEMIEKLNAASGADFDKTYLAQQTTAHGEALLLHGNYAAEGDKGKVKDFAKATTRKVEQHADMLKQLSQGGIASEH